MFKTLFVAAAAIAFGAAGVSSAFALTQAPSAQSSTSAAANKTSDRTPGDAPPDRTPGASVTGAAGTEAAQTPEGTSDRTPSNHYRGPTN